MGLFYASGRLVYNLSFEYFISLPVPQCGLQGATLSPAIYGPRKLLTITAHKSCLQLYKGLNLLAYNKAYKTGLGCTA